MKIEKYCCTLEQARTLKQLGVLQSSLMIHDIIPFELNNSVVRIKETDTHNYQNCLSAFNASELMAMMPMINVQKMDDEGFDITDDEGLMLDKDNWSTTIADSLAHSLIYAIKERLTTIQEVNERLISFLQS